MAKVADQVADGDMAEAQDERRLGLIGEFVDPARLQPAVDVEITPAGYDADITALQVTALYATVCVTPWSRANRQVRAGTSSGVLCG